MSLSENLSLRSRLGSGSLIATKLVSMRESTTLKKKKKNRFKLPETPKSFEMNHGIEMTTCQSITFTLEVD